MPSFIEMQKAKIAASFNLDEGLNELTKSEIYNIEKGGKRAMIGEKRTFAGREYIKTTDGWKFHGKGTESKAQSHVAGALEHHVGEKKESEETGSTLADYGAHLDRSKVTKEDIEEFDNSLSESDRSLIDSKMKEYRSQGGAFHSPGDILDFKKKALKGKSKSTHKNATDHFVEEGGKHYIDALDPDSGEKKFKPGDKVKYKDDSGKQHKGTISDREHEDGDMFEVDREEKINS